MSSKALIVVDVQKAFCDGGTLVVPDSESLIAPLNIAIQRALSLGFILIFTRDWHPPNHESFIGYGGQWPTHCVANTTGAEFHNKLYVPDKARIISKGTTPHGDGYSPYESNEMMKIVSSIEGPIYVTGIALEYCVKATCVDTFKLGKKAIVIKTLVRSVSKETLIIKNIWKDILKCGCEILEEFPFKERDHKQ